MGLQVENSENNCKSPRKCTGEKRERGNLISQKRQERAVVYFPLCKPSLVAFALPALCYSLLAAASSSSCLLWLNPPCNSSIFSGDDDGSVDDVDGGDVDGGGGGGVVMTESSLQLIHRHQQSRESNIVKDTTSPGADCFYQNNKLKNQANSPEDS